MTDTYAKRRAVGDRQERLVPMEAAKYGWRVEAWGRGQLSTHMQELLSSTDSPLRWEPDQIAIRGQDVLLLEDKASKPDNDYPDFLVEKRTLDAMHRCGLRAVVVIIWPDFKVNYVKEVHDYERKHRRSMKFRGNGSGTPAWMYPRKLMRQFEEIFGPGVVQPFHSWDASLFPLP